MGETLPSTNERIDSPAAEAAREALRRTMRPLETGYAERHDDDNSEPDDIDPKGLTFSA